MDVSVERDESCFDLPEWKDLLRRDRDRHLFATPEWNRLWWEEFGSDKDLLVLTMSRYSEVVAIVPLYRKTEDGRQVLRFIGGIDLTDYLGPICSSDDREDVAHTLVDWLTATDVAWDEFDAHNLPVPFGFSEFLVDWADRRGLDFFIDQEDTTAVLPLPGDWDSYLESLGPKNRHELKRKRRKLERLHPDAVLRSSTDETLDIDLKSFIDMHRDAEGHKGRFMRPAIATFFERVARAFSPLGWLRLDLLEIAGTPIASTFGFQLGSRFYLYNSAYEPEFSSVSPGFTIVSELIRRSLDEGVKLVDFLRGSERYKYEFGAQAVPLDNVRISRRIG
ncbi:MAG: GNAT family N-acetyltransferase [Actinomycetota bacterium]|nr:GNAT family N-acetyltransferase [Actinomycetota bacterium]